MFKNTQYAVIKTPSVNKFENILKSLSELNEQNIFFKELYQIGYLINLKCSVTTYKVKTTEINSLFIL